MHEDTNLPANTWPKPGRQGFTKGVYKSIPPEHGT